MKSFSFRYVFSWYKIRKSPTSYQYINHRKSAAKKLFRWRFHSAVFAPPKSVIFCYILRKREKQKLPTSFRNQELTSFYFSSKWCYQKSNKIDKWLYFFEFTFCKRPNLPLLLHRFSAMLCFFFVVIFLSMCKGNSIHGKEQLFSVLFSDSSSFGVLPYFFV